MDAKVVRLVSGECIVGEVTQDERKVYIKKPRNMMLNQTPQGMALGLTPVGIPGICEEENEIAFDNHQVIWVLKGTKQLQEQYMKETTGIVTATSLPGGGRLGLVR